MYLFGILLAFLSALLLGVSNILVKKGFKNISQRYGVFITVVFSLLSVIVVSAADGELLGFTGIGLIPLGLFALVGFLNFTMGRSLKYASIKQAGPSTTSALISTRIFFALLFSLLLIHETLTVTRIAGDVLMFAGVAAVTLGRGVDGKILSSGILFALAAGAFLGLSDVLISIGDTLYNLPTNGLMISYMASSITFLPMLGKSNRKVTGDSESRKYLWLMLAGVGISSGLAQAARFFSLSITPVSVAVPVISLTPILTMMLSLFLLKTEKITYIFVIGVALAFAGSVLLSL